MTPEISHTSSYCVIVNRFIKLRVTAFTVL